MHRLTSIIIIIIITIITIIIIIIIIWYKRSCIYIIFQVEITYFCTPLNNQTNKTQFSATSNACHLRLWQYGAS